ncbi:MAG TPA: acyl-CoA dehydratase activase-related protein [Desulfobacteria bacterium]|nr:acyl-CoA dehydratase activase-related protein [Desulfobacteria bacterium]
MPVKIGIPRALSYYAYYPLWKTFFESLGHETVTSSLTTKHVLDNGIKEAVTDACVPIKLFHGHVYDLRERSDFIFIPRFVSVCREKKVTFCPKFLGLPDMIRASMSDLPPLLDVRVDLSNGWTELFKVCFRLGKRLDNNLLEIVNAFNLGLKAQRRYEELLLRELNPMEAVAVLEGNTVPVHNRNPKLKFALLGFPYTVYDKFINVDITNKLMKMGIKILTTEMVPPKFLLAQAKKVPKNLFWYFGNQVLRAALYYMDHVKVDGIIHITAFGCGPDAMVDKMIELEAKHRGPVPFMSITIDEHTGEAGLMTRLEAFVDMLQMRSEMA